MSNRPLVAGSTLPDLHMVIGDRPPAAGGVAAGAAARVVIFRAAVAALAVAGVAVEEIFRYPCAGIVALAAIPTVVPGWLGMTGGAGQGDGVIEALDIPGDCAVTG